MRRNSVYAQRVMEDLDILDPEEAPRNTGPHALLADLQNASRSASVTSSYTATPPRDHVGVASPSYRTSGTSPRTSQGGRASQTPPPLPPPPHDIPDTIPPPQQFGDQPLYEAQNVRRDTNRHSGSSQGSANPPSYYSRDLPPAHPSSGPAPAGQGSSMISNNLSELDQLLSDLNSAQFMAEVDKKHSQPPTPQSASAQNSMAWNSSGKPPPPVAPKPSRGGGGGASSVDNLLDQLESSAPPMGPHGGYPVQANAVNGSYQMGSESHAQSYSYSSAGTGPHSPPHSAHISPAPQQSSVATQELDDLMQSLSGFKMKDKPPGAGGPATAQQVTATQQAGQHIVSPPPQPQTHQVHQFPANPPPPPRSPSPGSEPSYAKPHKSRNLSQSSSANSSLQSSSMTMGSAQGGQLESMLGDLQSDLSKQGVNTQTKGLCAACNQPVVGQVITALGKIWHIEHFTCDHCHEVLGTKNFYERDGLAYCERDYHSLFAPRCAYCNGPITDKCVTALGHTWHPEHFFCAQCGRPFGEDGFHEKDGKAYCRADFFEMFAPKCGGCGRAIVDNYISALNRHWHPECFACFDCHHPFAGGKFFDYEGLPYCETHYHAKRGSLCAGCQKPIAGRCITAMSQKFHPEHFVCAFCLKQLNKGTFKEQNDRPYCHPCFVKLFG